MKLSGKICPLLLLLILHPFAEAASTTENGRNTLTTEDQDLSEATTAVPAHQTHCYSCMSRRLHDNWHIIWPMFRRPEHFTEHCDPDHFKYGHVKLRNCTDQCITLIAETQIFGQKIPVYTRGCMSDLLNYRRDAVPKVRSGNTCVYRHLSELYNDGDRKFPSNDIVTLCVCNSNYCNGAYTRTSSSIVARFLPVLVTSGLWRSFTL